MTPENNLDALFEQLKERAAAAMVRGYIPGVALGVIAGGRRFSAGLGVTSLENPLPVTDETLFQIGSITKTFTALVVMRLVEQGALDLDVPLRTYLPDLRLADPDVTARVTLRHIFSHTGGWLGDYFDDLGPGDDALARIVERLVDLPQETPLGAVFSYNNAGYYLAGRVIEIVTGQTYEAAAKTLALDPLGMSRSFFAPADVMTYRFAVGHDAVYPGEDRSPRLQRPWALARTGNPVGGLTAPIVDLLRYARFQMGDGRFPEDGPRLLSPERLAEMHTPRTPAANGEQLGVSWFISQPGGVRIVRHGGATNGQMATFRVAPQAGFALVVLTNSDRGDELYQPLARWAFEQYLGLVEPEPQPEEAAQARLAEYAGRYTAAAQDILLEPLDGSFQMHLLPKGGFPAKDSPPPAAPPPTSLALCGPDQAIVTGELGRGNQGEFLRGADGRIAWFRFGGRVHRRIEA